MRSPNKFICALLILLCLTTLVSGQTLDTVVVNADNTSATIAFSEPVYTNSGGTGVLEMADLTVETSGSSSVTVSSWDVSQNPDDSVATLSITLSGNAQSGDSLVVTVNPSSIYTATMVEVSGSVINTLSDLTNPLVNQIVLTTDTISDDDVGAFTISVEYNEVMQDDGGADPTISFPSISQNTLTSPVYDWPDNSTFRASYSVVDYPESITGIDIQVTGGTDTAGNVHGTYDSLDALVIDTENPSVSTLVFEGGEDSLSDATGTLEVLVTFSEVMDQTSTPLLTYTPTVTGALQSTGSGWDDSDTYRFSYNVLDSVSLGSVDIEVSGGTDLVGNTSLDSLFSDTLYIDTKNPSVSTLVFEGGEDSLSDATGTLEVLVTFSEVMDQTSTPLLTYTPTVTGALQSTGSGWDDSDTYRFSYNVLDSVSLGSVDIEVSGGTDLVGNTSLDSLFSDTLYIDTKNPSVSTLVFEGGEDSLSDATGTLEVLVTFSEVMDQTSTPLLTYTPTVTGALQSTGSGWDDSDTYRFSYNVLDSVSLGSVDIEVSGGTDLVGNTSLGSLFSDTLYIDTKNPSVSTLVFEGGEDSLSDATGTLEVLVTFSEVMDQTSTPLLTYTPTVTGALQSTGSGWDDSDTYRFSYNVLDSVSLGSVDIEVSGGTDLVGNTSLDSLFSDTLYIDTKNPSVSTLVFEGGEDSLSDATGTLEVLVTFSEVMDQTSTPLLTYTPTVTGALQSTGSGWDDSDTYRFSYNVLDSISLGIMDITVSGGTDLVGNTSLDSLFSDTLYIDTKNPSVSMLVFEGGEDSLSDATGTLEVLVTFSEVMDQTSTPLLTYTPTVTGALQSTGSGWDDSDTYRFSYNVLDSVSLGSVDIEVSGGTDLVGNTSLDSLFSDTLYIDTKNPSVSMLVFEGGEDSLSDATGTLEVLGWDDSDTYRFSYNVLDSVSLGSVDIEVSGGTDLVGNTSLDSLFSDTLYIDTKNPSVSMLVFEGGEDSLSDATGTLEVLVTFSEVMDQTSTPLLTYTPTVTGALQSTGSGWDDSDTYRFSYNVLDSVSLGSVDIEVSGGTDLVDNTSLSRTFTDTLYFDTKNPSVIALEYTLGEDSLRDATGTFEVAVSYSEVMKSGTSPVLTFSEDVSMALSETSASWTLNDSVYTFVYDVLDSISLGIMDITVSGGTDLVDNTSLSRTFTDTLYFDTKNPSVIALEYTLGEDSLRDATGTFEVAVSYSEVMKSGTSPVLTFSEDVSMALSETSASWTLNDSVYTFVYDVLDSISLGIMDITVSGGTDLVDNTSLSRTFTDTLYFDTKNPSVIALEYTLGEDSLRDATGTFEVAVSYSEVMKSGTSPVLTFSEDVSMALSETSASWTLNDSVYTFVYDVLDSISLGIMDITVSGGTDLVDNTSLSRTFTDTLYFDTKNPSVIALEYTLGEDSLRDATGTFEVAVSYSEVMKSGTSPVLTFSEDVSMALSETSASWTLNDSVYTFVYDVLDSISLGIMDITVSGGTDLVDNTSLSRTFTDTLYFDTKNPSVIALEYTLGEDSLRDATGTFEVAVSYSEVMKSGTSPVLTFSEDVSMALSETSASWTLNDSVYTFVYDVLDSISLGIMDITVSGGTDLVDNTSLSRTFTDTLYFDTKNPSVIALEYTLGEDSLRDATGTFEVAVSYSEVMKSGTSPVLTFSEDVSMALSETSASWTLNDSVYTFVYDVLDSISLGIMDITVSGGTDLVDNTSLSRTFTDTLYFDTKNPSVIALEYTLGEDSLRDATGTFEVAVSYSEVMKSGTSPVLTFSEDVSMALSETSASWTLNDSVYTFVYDVLDSISLGIMDITVSGGTDLVDNTSLSRTFTDTLYFDTKNPSVIALEYTLGEDSLRDATGTFEVAVSYSEVMKSGTSPVLTFSEDVSMALSETSASWTLNDSVYTFVYDVLDSISLGIMDITVSGGTDLVDNTSLSRTFTDTLYFDTKNPSVIALEYTLGEDSLRDATGTFEVAVSYSEVMKSGTSPVLTFSEDVSMALSETSASWTLNDSVYTFVYDVLDSISLGIMDITVSGGTDLVDNTSLSRTFTDTLYFDTKNPSVIALEYTLGEDSLRDATGTFEVAVSYSEVMKSGTSPVLTFSEDVSMALSETSASWTLNDSVYTFVYDVLDSISLGIMDITVSGGTDLVDNTSLSRTFTDTLYFDTKNPSVIALEYTLGEDSLRDATGTFEVAVSYSEVMKSGTSPVLTFSEDVSMALSETSASWTLNDSVYTFVYDVLDSISLGIMDITVSGGTDLVDNTSLSRTFTDTLYFDTKNPSVIALEYTLGEDSLRDATGTFEVAVSYSEVMKSGTSPVLTFSEDVSMALSETSASWTLNDSVYTFVYDVLDSISLGIMDITVSGGTDLVDNTSLSRTFTDTLYFDTKNPSVIALEYTLGEDSLRDATGTFEVAVSYSEVMKSGTSPVLTFSEDVSSALSETSASWTLNDSVYTFVYDVLDSISLGIMDITVSGGTDLVDNTSLSRTFTDTLYFDTKNPSVIALEYTLGEDSLRDATGTFEVAVSYSEVMKSGTSPVLTFSEDVSSALSETSASWTLNDSVYTFVYDVLDSISLGIMDITVSGGTDLVDNTSLSRTFTDTLYFDTKNPSVIALEYTLGEDSLRDATGTFEVAVSYSEVMKSGTSPVLTFSEDVSMALSETSASWTLNDSVYTFVYDVLDSISLGIMDITVSGGTDLVDNTSLSRTFTDTLYFDTKNPSVIALEYTLGEDSLRDATGTFEVAVSYSEVMKSGTSPVLTFSEDVSMALSETSASWTLNDSVYTFVYDVLDSISLGIMDITVSGGTDLVDNTSLSRTFTDTLYFDTKNPSVIALEYTLGEDSLRDATGTFEVAVSYSEVMKSGTSPVLTFSEDVSSALSETSASWTLNDSVYTFVYDVLDSISLGIMDITVSGGTDLVDNTSLSRTFTDTLYFDTKNPSVIALEYTLGEDSLRDATGTFEVAVSYSEVMKSGTSPVLTFSEDVSMALSETSASWTLNDSVYTFVYDVLDSISLGIMDITVSGGTDLVDNTSLSRTFTDTLYFDTKNPSVIALEYTLGEDSLRDATGTFEVAVSYSEVMKSGTSPVLTFSEDVSMALSETSASWTLNDSVYTFVYDVLDSISLGIMDITVSGGTDLVDNTSLSRTFTDTLYFDTKNPSVIALEYTLGEDSLRDATGTFEVAVSYSEVMKSGTSPVLTFSEDVSMALSETSASWTLNDSVYTFVYDVLDSISLGIMDITVSGGTDLVDNTSLSRTFTDTLYFDTKNPSVIALEYTLGEDSLRDATGTFEVAVSYSEVMKSGTSPVLTFSEDVSMALSETSASWTLNDSVYTFVYDVLDSISLGIMDITVSGGTDLVDNTSLSRTFTDTLYFDTKNPSVIALEYTLGEDSLRDATGTFEVAVSYSEVMKSGTSPVLTFSEDVSMALSETSASWTLNDSVYTFVYDVLDSISLGIMDITVSGGTDLVDNTSLSRTFTDTLYFDTKNPSVIALEYTLGEDSLRDATGTFEVAVSYSEVMKSGTSPVLTFSEDVSMALSETSASWTLNDSVYTFVYDVLDSISLGIMDITVSGGTDLVDNTSLSRTFTDTLYFDTKNPSVIALEYTLGEDSLRDATGTFEVAVSYSEVMKSGTSPVLTFSEDVSMALSETSASWTLNDSVYTFVYDVLDSISLGIMDITVSGGTDLVDNTSLSRTFTDTLYFDTKNPSVIALEYTLGEDSLRDATGTFEVAVSYSEVMKSGTSPVLTFSEDVSMALSETSASWTLNDSVYTFVYDVLDSISLGIMDITVSGGTDLVDNTSLSRTFTDTLYFDTKNPSVIALEYTLGEDSLRDATGTFEVAVSYSEVMKSGTSPVLTFSEDVSMALSETSASWTLNDSVYTFVYDVLDSISLGIMDITVSGGTDLVDNTSLSRTFTDTLYFDTKNPSVIALEYTLGEDSLRDATGTFEVAVSYSEVMKSGTSPVLTFSEDVSMALSETSASWTLNDSVYTFVYDVLDSISLGIMDITVSGGTDLVDNTSLSRTFTDTLYFDTKNPSVIALEYTLGEDSLRDATGTFEVAVSYSEVMKSGTSPVLTFSEDVSSALSETSASWTLNDSVYTFVYDVLDSISLGIMDITVSGGTDLVDNTSLSRTFTDTLYFDTKNPSVIALEYTLGEDSLRDATGTFEVAVSYSEVMKSGTSPVLTFSEDVSSALSETSASWTLNDSVYTFVYDVLDSISLGIMDITVSGGTDLVDNTSLSRTFTDTLYFDTKNPSVIALEYTLGEDSLRDATGTFEVAVSYSEVMKSGTSPVLTFSEDVSMALSETSASWTLNDSVYTFVYDVLDSISLGIMDITVSGGTDLVDNTSLSRTFTDTLYFDTKNPSVIALEYTLGEDSLRDATGTFEVAVSYSEVMKSGTSPVLTFSEDVSMALSETSASWTLNDSVYTFVYDVLDSISLGIMDITVSGGTDLVDNTSLSRTFTDTLYFDTKNPSVIALEYTLGEDSLRDATGTFEVAVSYSEVMKSGTSPVLTFSEDVSMALSETSASWTLNDSVYTFVYDVLDSISLGIMDITVSGGTDLVDNTSLSRTFTDTLYFDTKNPSVIALEYTLGEDSLRDATGTFEVAVSYSEVMKSGTSPVLTFSEDVSMALSETSASWTLNDSVYTFVYDVLDSISLGIMDITVSGGTDLVDNTSLSRTFTDTLYFDTKNPSVIALEYTLGEDSLRDATGTFEVAVSYSEVMKSGTSPVLTFSEDVSMALSETSASWTLNDSVYTFVYDVLDSISLGIMDITVSGGTDLVDNTSLSRTFTDTLYFDTKNPSVIALEYTLGEDSLRDATGTFEVAVSYSEVMKSGTSPVLTFSEDVSMALSETSASWTLNDSVYTFVYDVLDSISLGIMDITVSGGTDLVDNTSLSRTFTDTLYFDTKNPSVIALEYTLGEDSLRDATGTFEVAVSYSEVMKSGTSPVLTFSEDVSMALSETSASWTLNDSVYTFVYDVLDSISLGIMDITVSGGTDLVDNTSLSRTFTDTLYFDTKNPTVTEIIVSQDTLNESVSSFSITINYSEDMDQNTTPTVTFPVENPLSAGLATNGGSWSDDDTYVANYTFSDADTLLADIDIQIEAGSATDIVGNGQLEADSMNAFVIDTENPILTISAPSADSTETSNVTFTVTYDDGDGIDNISLDPDDITLNATLTADANIAVSSTGVDEMTVTLSGFTGVGNMGISIASSTATDNSGNPAEPAGPSQTFRVQKTITVEADDQSKIYGDANPDLTVTYTGFQGTDNADSLSVQSVASTTADETSIVGTYKIDVSMGYDPYYLIDTTGSDGVLTVNKATLEIVAVDTSRTYGDANPEFRISYSGFVNSEDTSVLDILPNTTTSADLLSDVGTYDILLTSASDHNYLYAYDTGTLTIEKAVVSVQVLDASKMYGDPNPTFIIDYLSGFKNDQDSTVIEEDPIVITAANTGTSVGEYSLELQGGTDENYSFEFTNGTLTIGRANLNLIVENKDALFTTNPEGLDFTYISNPEIDFRNNDTRDVLGGEEQYQLTADASNPEYEFTVNLSGLTSTNYNITFTPGKLTLYDGTSISGQPEDVTSCGADSIGFTVQGEGDFEVTYTWEYRENENDEFQLASENTEFVGANSASLVSDSVRDIWSGYQFRAMVSSDFGPDVTSEVVTLTVNETPPIAYLAAKNSNVLVGAYNNLDATYQWKRNGQNISGENKQYISSDTPFDLENDEYSLLICIDDCCVESKFGMAPPPSRTDSAYFKSGMTVGPNPSEGQFELTWTNPYTGEFNVRLVEATGNPVTSETLIKNEEEFVWSVDVGSINPNYTSGIYFIIVEYDGRINTQKIFIIR